MSLPPHRARDLAGAHDGAVLAERIARASVSGLALARRAALVGATAADADAIVGAVRIARARVRGRARRRGEVWRGP